MSPFYLRFVDSQVVLQSLLVLCPSGPVGQHLLDSVAETVDVQIVQVIDGEF